MVRSTAERSTIVLWRGHCVRQKICRGALGPHDAPVELIPAVRPVALASKTNQLQHHLDHEDHRDHRAQRLDEVGVARGLPCVRHAHHEQVDHDQRGRAVAKPIGRHDRGQPTPPTALSGRTIAKPRAAAGCCLGAVAFVRALRAARQKRRVSRRLRRSLLVCFRRACRSRLLRSSGAHTWLRYGRPGGGDARGVVRCRLLNLGATHKLVEDHSEEEVDDEESTEDRCDEKERARAVRQEWRRR